MTETANALPAPVEPEVLYQSWDPFQGEFVIRVQFLDALDGWVDANRSLIRGHRAEPGDEFKRTSFPDTDEGRNVAKVKAYQIARNLGIRTRTIREQLPV
ncbi:hypothetical protein SEA_BIG4_305 [Microbacterium phage Big4]|nr:hypothetical protein SEA_BIG4_305 [Microbacterium phage Big4]